MADVNEYTKKANQARLKAQRTFVKRYPDEFAAWHDQVREEMGLRPGGLGLVMTRAMVDEVIYNEKRNEVVLVKYLD